MAKPPAHRPEADPVKPDPSRPDARAEREARLATALRANLRRRKAQARAREVPPDKPEGQR